MYKKCLIMSGFDLFYLISKTLAFVSSIVMERKNDDYLNFLYFFLNRFNSFFIGTDILFLSIICVKQSINKPVIYS